MLPAPCDSCAPSAARVFCRVLFVICCLAPLTHHFWPLFTAEFLRFHPSIHPARSAVFLFLPLHRPCGSVFFSFFFLPGLHTPAFAAYASDIAPLQWQCHSLVAGHWPHLVSGRILKRSGSWQNIEHLSPQDGNSKKGFKIGWTLVPK